MVRTRADNCSRKAVASKAPRKNFNAGGSSSSSSAADGSQNTSFNVVNHAKMWPAPKWQKGIGSFFQKRENTSNENESSSGSSSAASSQSPTKDERKEETNDVIVLDEKTDNSPDNATNDTENASDKNENTSDKENDTELLKTAKRPSGKQKVSVSGKSLNQSNKKKRRVVLHDSSDEE